MKDYYKNYVERYRKVHQRKLIGGLDEDSRIRRQIFRRCKRFIS